jgi:hypothetical protein
MLVEHVKESFVLASTMFKFITQPAAQGDYSTPMGRLPLALQINGLDTLYVQTLTRSQNLPHFCSIISTIALVAEPLPIVGIAELLAIETFEVIRVLLNLQGIIHVPGTDEGGNVTLCHTSLRDFLTTKSRSGSFFVPPSYHLNLSYCCFSSIFQKSSGLAHDYGMIFLYQHWRSFAESNACDFADEIEQFKARQPLQTHRLSYHPFLCSAFFYSLFWLYEHPVSEEQLLAECTKQLALSMEFPDDCTKLWLETKLFYSTPRYPVHVVQLTEQTHRTVQLEMQRVSSNIHAQVNFCLSFFNPLITDNFCLVSRISTTPKSDLLSRAPNRACFPRSSTYIRPTSLSTTIDHRFSFSSSEWTFSTYVVNPSILVA